MIVDFIREHADHQPAAGGLRWGVEPICAVLSEHGVKIAPSTYHEWRDKLPSAREQRDQVLLEHIHRVHAENFGVYGPRKVWLVLNREGIPVARCTIERLTYVSTWAGWTYVAFVIDAYARRILGWRAATSMTADLVLDAVEQAIWTRQRDGRADFTALVAHHAHGSQYLSLAHSQRLADAGIRPSVGTVGSSYDNALAESINGLYKTEVIRRQAPWRNVDAVEIATAEWVEWYNHRRLNEYCGDMSPVVLEQVHYAHQQPSAAS